MHFLIVKKSRTRSALVIYCYLTLSKVLNYYYTRYVTGTDYLSIEGVRNGDLGVEPPCIRPF